MIIKQLRGPNFSRSDLIFLEQVTSSSLFKWECAKCPLFWVLSTSFWWPYLAKMWELCIFITLYIVLSYFFVQCFFLKYNLVYTVLCSTVNESKIYCMLSDKSPPHLRFVICLKNQIWLLLIVRNWSNHLHMTQLKDQMLYVFVSMFVKDNALPHWDVLFPYTVCNCNCNLSRNHV